MTALIDWREDAPLPTRTVSWFVWAMAMAGVAVVVAGVMVVVMGSASGERMSSCRLHEEREGIPALEKMDVPLVGQQPRPGWVPPNNVRVQYASTADALPGSVTDETMCGQPTGRLLVTIAR